MNTNASGSPVRLRTPQRQQMTMVVQCPDDLLPPEHPARVVWDVAGRLDLTAFCSDIKAVEGVAGRDSTDPRLLVSLWLYASIEGVGSARRLDELCREHDAYKWLCGGVSLNYHTLSDFRVGHGQALDELFTSVLATLAEQGLVSLKTISQDGMRVRASAGADSFRREEQLGQLLEQAKAQVEELKRQVNDPAYAADVSARQKAARQRAARERLARVQQAVKQLPELQEAQKQLATKCSQKQKEELDKKRQPRASTTDPEVRRMKMPDGGFRPAVNVQLATDTASRAIVGVTVSNRGVDNAGQSPEMRQQVQERLEGKVRQHLMDGGYVKAQDIDQAAVEGVEVYMPPKPPRNTEKRSSGCDPMPGDSPAVAEWRRRMGSDAGKEVYKLRASTSETVNADLRCFRGLGQFVVRGMPKILCVALWSALAYNVMHFASALLR